MLNNTFEFLRIADPQPNDEKVRKRKDAANQLLGSLIAAENRNAILDCVQGIVSGFDKHPFTNDSPTVGLVLKAIKEFDTALPEDVTENALELRALAAIAVGELVANTGKAAGTVSQGLLAALSLRSALSLRPAAKDKYLHWILETLLDASDQHLRLAAQRARKRSTTAQQQFNKIKESSDAAEVWKILTPLKAALKEAAAQESIDREEIDTLWWMFEAYSDLGGKPVIELTPSEVPLCVGVELAKRALLPPSPSAIGMVKRAVESGRKQSDLAGLTIQKMLTDSPENARNALCTTDSDVEGIVAGHPALLPVSWACKRLQDVAEGAKLGKEFTTATGIPVNQGRSATEWAQQGFREKIIHRVLGKTDEETS